MTTLEDYLSDKLPIPEQVRRYKEHVEPPSPEDERIPEESVASAEQRIVNWQWDRLILL